MVPKGASFFKNDDFRFLVCITTLDFPSVNLNSPLSTIKANSIRIFQNDKFLLERKSLIMGR